MQVIAKIEKWAQQPDVQTQNGMTSKAQVVLRMSGGRNAEGLPRDWLAQPSEWLRESRWLKAQ